MRSEKGSTFRVCLPLGDGAEKEEGGRAAPGQADEPFEQAFGSLTGAGGALRETGSDLEFSIVGQGEQTF